MRDPQRTLILAGLAMSLLTLQGCDENARLFARKMHDLLVERGQLIEDKINAEKRAYRELADVFAQAAQERRLNSLANDRTERALALSLDYAEKRKSPQRWNLDIGDLRKSHFDTQMTMLTEELDATARQLTVLEELRVEKEKIIALDRLLATLARKKSLEDEMKFLQTFNEDTSKAYQKLVCDGAREKLAAASAAADKASWTQFLKDKGCDAK